MIRVLQDEEAAQSPALAEMAEWRQEIVDNAIGADQGELADQLFFVFVVPDGENPLVRGREVAELHLRPEGDAVRGDVEEKYMPGSIGHRQKGVFHGDSLQIYNKYTTIHAYNFLVFQVRRH